MREIKFRGKAILNGEWIKGYLFYDYNNADEYRPFITYKSEAFLGGVNEQQIDKDTIGQYTGLHDKNGKEIYEGDVVKIDCPTMKMTGEIKYSEMSAMFYIYDVIEDIEETLWYQKEEYEVIGNIYKNTELLEDK